MAKHKIHVTAEILFIHLEHCIIGLIIVCVGACVRLACAW